MNIEQKEKADASTGVETSSNKDNLYYNNSLPQKNENINIKNRRSFVMIDKEVLLSDKLGTYEKVIYSILCSYTDNKDKTCYPSYKTIAQKAGCKRRKAIDILSKLVDEGLVKKEQRITLNGFHRSNIYTVLEPPSGALSALCPSAGQTPSSACNALGGASHAPKLDTLNNTKLNYIHLSINKDEMDILKTDIEYEYFKETMPDMLLFIDSLLGYIIELQHENDPAYRNLLSNLNSCIIQEFFEEMKRISLDNVRNMNKYIKRIFVEFLRTREMQMAAI